MRFSHFTRKTPEYRLSGNKKALNSVSSGLKILGSVDKKDTRLKYGVKRQNKKPCLEGTVKTDIFKSEHPTRKPLY